MCDKYHTRVPIQRYRHTMNANISINDSLEKNGTSAGSQHVMLAQEITFEVSRESVLLSIPLTLSWNWNFLRFWTGLAWSETSFSVHPQSKEHHRGWKHRLYQGKQQDCESIQVLFLLQKECNIIPHLLLLVMLFKNVWPYCLLLHILNNIKHWCSDRRIIMLLLECLKNVQQVHVLPVVKMVGRFVTLDVLSCHVLTT